MKYGLPYKGSKNKLAERIVRLLPKKTNLVDLFCGGCAVSHAAMVMGKYKHIHINDINWMCPTLFIDAISGKYNDESRWISREDFFRLKDKDPYVAVVWSFGNNMRDYLYSREIEPLKKAIHYALFFSDYSLAKNLGYDLSFIDPINDLQKRYMAVKHYFNQFGHFRQQSFEGGGQNHGMQPKSLNTNLQNWGGKTGRSDCSQWNGGRLLRSFKKKKESCDVGKWQTSNEGTFSVVLESYERTRRLRQCSAGGVFRAYHILCVGLSRRGHTRRQRDIL